jgi:hypothetical protein
MSVVFWLLLVSASYSQPASHRLCGRWDQVVLVEKYAMLTLVPSFNQTLVVSLSALSAHIHAPHRICLVPFLNPSIARKLLLRRQIRPRLQGRRRRLLGRF